MQRALVDVRAAAALVSSALHRKGQRSHDLTETLLIAKTQKGSWKIDEIVVFAIAASENLALFMKIRRTRAVMVVGSS